MPENHEPAWVPTLSTIAALQRELCRLAPYRDAGLVPNAPARPELILRAERRIGRKLPPSYRAFLARHDGWPRFFDGAALLGTADLGRRQNADLARAVFESSESPIPWSAAPPTRVGRELTETIPFGLDAAGTTLFAFDATRADATGEMPVIAWISEIGIRRASFGDFLHYVLELCEADAASLSEAWLKSA